MNVGVVVEMKVVVGGVRGDEGGIVGIMNLIVLCDDGGFWNIEIGQQVKSGGNGIGFMSRRV